MSHPLLQDARSALAQLGFPNAQANERSALCLLALLDLTPKRRWRNATNPQLGTTPIMNWIAQHAGVVYKPNTRETIRRQTLHQFVDAGLVLRNPTAPARATNSPKTDYQMAPDALALLKTFGTRRWAAALKHYRAAQPGLAQTYQRQRALPQVPVCLPNGQTLSLSAGEHSQLIRAIVESFAPRFAPGADVLYVGDTGSKAAVWDTAAFTSLGLTLNTHGKMPDVVLRDTARGWLLLVEAVTSHGPVDAKRHAELRTLFGSSSAGLVYVTAFPSRAVLKAYVADLAWETEAWVAEDPDHLIHFDGERFLGPYST